ncbi:hypothetical protein [Micromonospora fulviviridis]|uniref:Helix-turn-helix domain-containing protein n=1 Tax=Micromonospora fulviviridis TaxID=47860 RepID=A0ABV2VUC2_9ACTN
MALHNYQPVGNGLRTDHPVPGLPFVDDSHIPVEDPRAVEAVGRNRGDRMWGRKDDCADGGWVAYTTDPKRTDLAWCVRWHPEHGRSVVLYRNADASGAYMTFMKTSLLFRAGGYWWDGNTWYRPSQVFDWASEEYLRRQVPAASTVTVADILTTDPGDQAVILNIDDVDTEIGLQGPWRAHLAAWVALRNSTSRPLSRCVVQLTAPELGADQLVTVTEMAEIAGLSPSTLRAYMTRGESSIPAPQAVVGGRNMWSRVVAEEWAEQRRRSPDGAADAMAANRDNSHLSVGVNDLWQQFTNTFTMQMWESPNLRKRWALRWRTEEAVREVATELGWSVAAGLDSIVPISQLARTIRGAVLDELATSHQMGGGSHDYVIFQPVAEMLDWLVRHEPRLAARTITEIIGEAERRMGIARDAVENAIADALALDGALDSEAYDEFLERALPPRN